MKEQRPSVGEGTSQRDKFKKCVYSPSGSDSNAVCHTKTDINPAQITICPLFALGLHYDHTMRSLKGCKCLKTSAVELNVIDFHVWLFIWGHLVLVKHQSLYVCLRQRGYRRQRSVYACKYISVYIRTSVATPLL